MVSLVPPSAISLIDLARLAVDLSSTPPASDNSCTEEAPSVTEVPWSACIFIVSLVPALVLRYIASAALLVLVRSISPDEAMSTSVTSASIDPFTSNMPGIVTPAPLTVIHSVFTVPPSIPRKDNSPSSAPAPSLLTIPTIRAYVS